MGKITNRTWELSYKKDVQAIMRFWYLFKEEGYKDRWIDHACYDFVRGITNLIGKQKIMSSKKAEEGSEKIVGHHLVPAKDFFNQWRNCVENSKEFTVRDAKEWFNKAQNLFVTEKEHLIIHSAEFKKFRKTNPSASIFDVLKHFKIEIA